MNKKPRLRWPVSAGLAVIFAASVFAAENLQTAVAAYQSGNLEEAKAMFEQMAAKEPKNRAVQNFLHQIDTKMAGRLAMKKKIDAIILSKVDLKDTSAHEAFEFIFQLLNRNAPQGFHPNMVWAVPENGSKNITLALENVPGSAVLEYAAKLAGLKVSYEEFAVRILPE
ncbi:MAG: hypothetical protein WCH98_09665 [Verrucomicrobiota bacterium]